KGVVMMATVEGDIHDIGKNIVKVVVESYGYRVIDLGKDVKAEDVVAAFRRHHPQAIGLSALMTTTLPSMEKTIRLLREEPNICPIWVGGAVLSEEYAKEIHADHIPRTPARGPVRTHPVNMRTLTQNVKGLPVAQKSSIVTTMMSQ
ncbi:MAG: cobalamin-dependent protein, partial [Merdibacter sp.]